MMPNKPGPEAPSSPPRGPSPVVIHPQIQRWYHQVWAVLLVTFCVEIGLFLVIFPWTSYWEINYFAQLVPAWHVYWYNSYVRGAVSGLGALNLYIAVLEIFRLRHLTRRRR